MSTGLSYSFVVANHPGLQVRHRQHPHDLQENVSQTSGAKSSDRVGVIIGAAAACSVVLLISGIFLGYWLKQRRRRRCPPSQTWISKPKHRTTQCDLRY